MRDNKYSDVKDTLFVAGVYLKRFHWEFETSSFPPSTNATISLLALQYPKPLIHS